MALKFKIGDIVQLKSGGPEMTVQSLPSATTTTSYRCQWFAGKKLESGPFPEESLMPVQPKTK
ncbi:YodC family protein [Burkholderia cepacia]|uniref:YodC family protein n=1 Tax=Burkholderia cepacia TaxID=292 RepID=UPI0009BEFE58